MRVRNKIFFFPLFEVGVSLETYRNSCSMSYKLVYFWGSVALLGTTFFFVVVVNRKKNNTDTVAQMYGTNAQ